MANPMKSGAIGVLVGVVIALVAVWVFTKPVVKPPVEPDKQIVEGGGKNPSQQDVAVTQKDHVSVPPLGKIQKESIPPAAVERVIPRQIKAKFAITGKGRDVKWGVGKQTNFQYTVFVEAESRILSKETLPTGKIEVHEKRTFQKVTDSVIASDVDFVLALDTLPVNEFSMLTDAAAIAIASWTGNPVTAGKIFNVKNTVVAELKRVDGKGVRDLLKCVGLQPTADIEDKLKKLANNQMTKVIGKASSISGKSYLINYLQEKSGQPMMVEFKNEDGSEITDEEEQMILKRVNAFIDYHLVPDKECNPGDSWIVYAEDMQELFDPFVEGRYSGKVKVSRMTNAENGDWKLEMSPSTVTIVGDGGSTLGSLRIDKGTAVVDPKNVSVNDLFVKGMAKMEKLSKHHLLFTAKIDGWGKFQGRAVTVPLEEK